jgi:hypothetical protein
VRYLFEEDDSPVSGMMGGVEEPPDSVDDQIDALIIRYEQDSIDSGEEAEEERMFESLRNMSMQFLLEEDPPEDPSGAPAAEPLVGSETPKAAPEAPDVKKPPLDIDLFAKKVARLVMNANNLLNVEEVIISRAMTFLKKNYGKNYAEQMQDILDNQFDFDLTGDEDVIDVPIAAGAATKSAGG